MPSLPPRLVVAGTHSGVGKTTAATGLMAALRRAGHRVAGAKVGPDFIDPGYHALACGRPPRNLDPWMCGAAAIPALATRAAGDADVLVIEGVAGLFDGAADGLPSSSADVARLLDAPVVLVVDASAMAASVAALVHGFATFDPTIRVGGVILNRVGSDGHAQMLREALAPVDVPVLGELRRDARLTWRDRRLGLIPAAEQLTEVRASIDQLAEVIATGCDLDAIVRLARTASPRHTDEVALPPLGTAVRVGVVGGAALPLVYQDTLDALIAGGAEVTPVDPHGVDRLPEGLDGLLIGGGLPEVHAAAVDAHLLRDLRTQIGAGLVTIAEGAGLLWLARSLDGRAMAGVIDVDARTTDRLTLGYRVARTTAASPIGPPGTVMRGHEFHYSSVDPAGDALEVSGRFGHGRAGFAHARLLASYVHHHPGGDPSIIAAFLDACRAPRQRTRRHQ